ncbi:hypothetical protein [Staphylococcus hominis]
MKKPYDKILENYKIKYKAIESSEVPSKFGESNMVWTTIFRDSLMLLDKEKITIEEAIEYLDEVIQNDADNHIKKL